MRNITLNAALAPSILLVSTDRVRLQRAIIDLTLNSMDAMSDTPETRRVVTVRTRLADTARVEVVIADCGTGFGSNIQHVFESFFTIASHSMGLVLSFTAAIVQTHGGRMSRLRSETEPVHG